MKQENIMVDAMDTPALTKVAIIGHDELETFKNMTNQLKEELENNNLDDALNCINEINELNTRNFYDLIGKLTRGLHVAISHLDISEQDAEFDKNKARVDLKYVIQVTHNAAAKTLDMTQKSMVNIGKLKADASSREQLIDSYLASHTVDDELLALLNELKSGNSESLDKTAELGSFVTEITMAQNYQDLASQSINKVIDIIKDVESSLVTLTQYTNLLRKLSNFGPHDQVNMDDLDTESLKSDIDKMNSVTNDHLDQSEVDNLLSSLGF